MGVGVIMELPQQNNLPIFARRKCGGKEEIYSVYAIPGLNI